MNLTFVSTLLRSMNWPNLEDLCIPQQEGQFLHNIGIAEKLDKQDTQTALSLFPSGHLLPSGP